MLYKIVEWNNNKAAGARNGLNHPTNCSCLRRAGNCQPGSIATDISILLLPLPAFDFNFAFLIARLSTTSSMELDVSDSNSSNKDINVTRGRNREADSLMPHTTRIFIPEFLRKNFHFRRFKFDRLIQREIFSQVFGRLQNLKNQRDKIFEHDVYNRL